MKKKLLAFIVIMALAFSLSACGNVPPADVETPPAKAQSAETVEPSAEENGQMPPAETDVTQNDAAESSEQDAETGRQDGECYEGDILLGGHGADGPL